MLIDVLIIKKNTKEILKKNIGQIFREHNIIEYKSPDDYLSIDDYYKVFGYTYFYKSDTETVDCIKLEELTITFVCSRYPTKLIRHLKQERGLTLEKHSEGIYYIQGELFPIQLVVTRQLSKEENLWLKSLNTNLSEKEAEQIIQAYEGHNHNKLYTSMMDVIVRANKKGFEEARKMCEALRELMKDEIQEELEKQKNIGISEGISLGISQGISQGISVGISQGEQQKLLELIQKKILKGKTLAQIADELEETESSIEPLYNQLLQ